MATTTYLVAIGANRRGRHGAPAAGVRTAIATLPGVVAASRVIASAPIGPSTRVFANAAVLVESERAPPAMLALLKRVERDAGRRRGRRWGARVLDLDLILWSGGTWRSRALTIPHPAFRDRAFVLSPASQIAARWRDPATGRSLRQLHHRLTAARPVNRR